MAARRHGTPTVRKITTELNLSDDIVKRYRKALEKLLCLRHHDPANFDKLVQAVLLACEEARRYKASNDPNAERRQRDREVLKEVPKTLRAIAQLRRFVRQYSEYVDFAMFGTFLQLRSEGIVLSCADRKMKGSATLDRVLKVLAEQFENNILAQRGPWFHRFQEGALLFEEPRDKQDRNLSDSAWTSLVFRLAYLLRRFTSGVTKQGESLYGGPDGRMPSSGRACYEIVAPFVDAALDQVTEDIGRFQRRFTDWLKHNPDASLSSWPRKILPPKKP